jgi:branched-chain amino acid transport system permease protein
MNVAQAARAPWRRDVSMGITVLAAAVIIPQISGDRYLITQLTLFFLWTTIVTQWNLVFGVAGIFSLGHMALFAFGGFTTGMMGLYLDWSLWYALPLAGFGTVLFSLLIALACLRLRGAYVALLTLAIAQAMYLLIITDTECFYMDGVTCRNLTGGTRGLTKYGDFGFRAILGRDWIVGDYYLTLGLLALATFFSIAIIRSPLGMAFRALRDGRTYAISRGVSQFKYQLIVFASSAFFTGLAGGVYAGHFKVMGANTLILPLMLFLLCMMVVGGLGRAWGPLLGAALLMLADEILKDFVNYRNMGIGLIIVLFGMLWPKGVVGAIEAAYERVGRIMRRRHEASNQPERGGAGD